MSVQSGCNPSKPLGPLETARYTAEMLDSLRGIALKNNQNLLAHLLSLACVEAKALSESNGHGDSQSQETLLPG